MQTREEATSAKKTKTYKTKKRKRDNNGALDSLNLNASQTKNTAAAGSDFYSNESNLSTPFLASIMNEFDSDMNLNVINSNSSEIDLVEQFDFSCTNLKAKKDKENLKDENIDLLFNPSENRKYNAPLTKFFNRIPSQKHYSTAKNFNTNNNSSNNNSSKEKRHQQENYSKRKRGKEQMYLDFGQKSLGARLSCSTCGLYYVKGDEEDEKMHLQFCKKMSKIPSFPMSLFHQQQKPQSFIYQKNHNAFDESSSDHKKSHHQNNYIKKKEGKIIGNEGKSKNGDERSSSYSLRLIHQDFNLERKVIEIRQNDYYSSNKLVYSKFIEIKRLMDADMDYATEREEVNYLSEGKKAYLIIDSEGQIMACIIAKPLQEAWEIPLLELEKEESNLIRDESYFREAQQQQEILDEHDPKRTGRKVKAYIGIHQMWVHPTFRRKGICSNLLDIIRAKFLFNFVVDKEYLAFSQLTSQGKSFAKGYLRQLEQSISLKDSQEIEEPKPETKPKKKIGIRLY